jgi:hypothetical protein
MLNATASIVAMQAETLDSPSSFLAVEPKRSQEKSSTVSSAQKGQTLKVLRTRCNSDLQYSSFQAQNGLYIWTIDSEAELNLT